MCVTCGLCGLCGFFGAKTHVVWSKEFREDKEFREKVAKGLFFLPKATPKSPFRKGGFRGNVDVVWPPRPLFFAKKIEAYRKVRHVNLKLVSS